LATKKSTYGKRNEGTKKKPSGKRSSSTRKKTTYKTSGRRPIRREVGGVICFFLAIFGILGFFGIDAIFIGFLRSFLGGMTGWGYYIYPLVFLLCAYILLFHRGRPVVWRVTASLLLPIALGALFFVTFNHNSYTFGWELFGRFYTEGAAMESAGVLTGFLGLGFSAAFSRIGAAIVFAILAIFFALSAINITVSGIVEYFRGREKLEYEVDEEAEEAARLRKEARAAQRKKYIDLPVDDPETIRKAREKEKAMFTEPTEEPRASVQDDKREKSKTRIPFVFGDPVDIQETAAPQSPQTAAPAGDAKQPVEFKPEPLAKPEPTKAEKRAEVNKAAEEVTQTINEDAEKEAQRPQYIKPPLDLLAQKTGGSGNYADELRITARRLDDTLKSFDIAAHMVDCCRGPTVTRYELELEQGVKLQKLTNLSNDIALSLGVTSVRIAPVPGKVSVVGVEVPNRETSTVYLREVLSSPEFINHKSKLAFALGKDIAGTCVVGDISKLPHLLIAGTTGSGKSVCTNSLIISLLYNASPEDVRLIMVDPKMVELGGYNGIPHLLIPVVTDSKKAAGALQWAVNEMMRRYSIFSEAGAKDIDGYNEVIRNNPERKHLHRIVIVVDELADLMMVAAKEVEEYVCRIAQMGRAAGMHLVVATQRPSANVITGIMKANIPSRIAFAVASAMESRIILDTAGAEKLVGKGDMLYQPIGATRNTRIQGTMVSNEEVEAVVEFIKQSAESNYSDEILRHIELHGAEKGEPGAAAAQGGADEADELLPDAIEVVVETGQASVSMLQRRLKLGYSRAARIVDQMEERGIIGPFEGSKPRQLLITKEQWTQMKLKGSVTATPGEGEYEDEPVEDEIY